MLRRTLHLKAVLAVACFALLLLIVVGAIHAASDEPQAEEGSVEDVLDQIGVEAPAEEEAPVGESSDGEGISNIAAGRALAAPCSACHGTDGNTSTPQNGNLAGQGERYLYEQLKLIQSDERPISTMIGQLTKFSDQDLRDMAAYYASLPGRIGQSKEEDLELGEKIYRGGIADKKVAACTACHGPFGNGNVLAGFPRLSGQPVEYIVNQMKSYREQERTTDEDYGGMMRDIAENLTDTEIEAVANYMTGLY